MVIFDVVKEEHDRLDRFLLMLNNQIMEADRIGDLDKAYNSRKRREDITANFLATSYLMECIEKYEKSKD